MVVRVSSVDEFTAFVSEHECRLRQALIASLGGQTGRDAAADALAYGWVHWDRVGAMENPVGYLYRVGLSRGRRDLSRRQVAFEPAVTARIPDVEPDLALALAALSQRQRAVVMLIHCFGWTQSEAAELLNVSKTTVQNHLERGMTKLRRRIGPAE